MSETLYDVFLTGKLKPGVELPQARTNLARLFKVPAEKAAQLVCGKPQLIKKGVDKAQAQRLMKLLQQAGMETGARKSGAEPSVSTPAQARQKPATDNGLQLSPEGTPVLREEERRKFTPVEIDTSGIKLVSAFAESPAANDEQPSIAAPDFGLAPAGSLLEQLPDAAEPINPDTSALSLAEPGVELGEIKPPPPPPPPATEHLQLQDQA